MKAYDRIRRENSRNGRKEEYGHHIQWQDPFGFIQNRGFLTEIDGMIVVDSCHNFQLMIINKDSTENVFHVLEIVKEMCIVYGIVFIVTNFIQLDRLYKLKEFFDEEK